MFYRLFQLKLRLDFSMGDFAWVLILGVGNVRNFGGQDWPRSGVVSPCKGPRTEETSRPSSQLPRTTTSPQDRKAEPDQASYISHMRSLGLEEAAC